MSRIPTRIAGLFGLLTLSACGGGDDGAMQMQAQAQVAAAAPAPVSVPAASAALPGLATGQRIEALDTDALPDSGPRADDPAPLGAAPPPLPAHTVRLGPLSAQELPAEIDMAKQQRSAPVAAAQQIGVARALAQSAESAQLLALLRWQTEMDGVRRAALAFASEGALGLRLGLLVRSLPAGAVLRFHAPAGAAVHQVTGADVLRSVQRNLAAGDTSAAARTYWAPDLGGAEVTLELELPAGADPAGLDLAVPSLSHLFASAQARADGASAKNLGDAGSCNIDISCSAEYARESRAVARISYVHDGASYKCTGTLLNDIGASRKPWFLTARHCIGTQTTASSVVTDWFYRSSGCNSGMPNPATQRRTGGAVLLYENRRTDTSFLLLNDAPPQGAVYAGSYFGALQPGAAVAGVHHARGDLQKLSTGAIEALSTCPGSYGALNCQPGGADGGQFLTVVWNRGVTERGSSGSGLFHAIGSKRYLIGQLFGGGSSCQQRALQDQYGRFDLAFERSLNKWLLGSDSGVPE